MQAETWVRLKMSPYKSYEVSNTGKVRRGGRELVGQVGRDGYRTVLLSYAGLSKRHRVNRLVCEAFHGPCPPGCEAAHGDGNPLNNAATNLRWTTRSDNNLDKARQGRPNGGGAPAGAAHPAAKLTAEQVAEVRRLAADGIPFSVIGKRFGVSKGQAHRIATGKRWAQGDAQPLYL